MRTNIVLDEALLTEASRFAAARTKKGIIEEALHTFVRVKSDEARRATYRDRVRQLQAETAGITLRESSSDLVRRDRESRR